MKNILKLPSKLSNKMSLFRYTSLFLLFVYLDFNDVFGQAKIILDSATKQPVPFVSIYTKKADKIYAAASDERGYFTLKPPYKQLIFTHINYEDLTLLTHNIGDTILLIPKSAILPEVVVSNAQPSWIVQLLLAVVKAKNKNYLSDTAYYQYDYTSFALPDSMGYAFRSTGNLLKLYQLGNEKYLINPTIGIIRYKDKTAGCDFGNLQKMLYDDNFIYKFDKKFMRNYVFKEKYGGNTGSFVTLYFQSKNYADRGEIVIDTITKAIIAYHRISGTDYNIKEKTTFILRSVAAATLGTSFKDMQSEISVQYSKIGGKYYLSASRTKTYISIVIRKKGQVITTASSSEGEITLTPTKKIMADWLFLPDPFYIGIETKKMRLSYEALQKIPKKYEPF